MHFFQGHEYNLIMALSELKNGATVKSTHKITVRLPNGSDDFELVQAAPIRAHPTH